MRKTRNSTSRQLARVTIVNLVRGMATAAGTAATALVINWLHGH
ncbi:hypothetical protein [Actinoallomurus sp. NPDC050550]